MKYKDLKTLQVPQRGPMDPNRKLPGSNHSPAGCQPTKADRIEGIPDLVQRPARKEVSLGSIGPGKEASDKGYKVVEVRSGGEPVGFPGGNGKRRRKGMEEDEDYD